MSQFKILLNSKLKNNNDILCIHSNSRVIIHSTAGLATGSVVYSSSTVKPSEINVVNSSMAIEAPPRRLVYKNAKAYYKVWTYTYWGPLHLMSFDVVSFWRPIDFFNSKHILLWLSIFSNLCVISLTI